MMLAFYTPYTFSSAIFGTIAPTLDLIRSARDAQGVWLNDDIIAAIDPDLHQRIVAETEASIQQDMLLQYFTTLYAQTDYTAFSERQEYVLNLILNAQSTTLDIINRYSQDFYTSNPYLISGLDPEPVTANHMITTHLPLRFHAFSTYAESINQALR